MTEDDQAQIRAPLSDKLDALCRTLPELESSYRAAGYSEDRFIRDMLALIHWDTTNSQIEKEMKKILEDFR